MVKYFYIRDKKKFPIACVASELVNDPKLGEEIHFAYSVYNPEDKFDRERAKEIALNRLNKKNDFSHMFGIVPAGEGVNKRILATVAYDTQAPRHVPESRKATN